MKNIHSACNRFSYILFSARKEAHQGTLSLLSVVCTAGRLDWGRKSWESRGAILDGRVKERLGREKNEEEGEEKGRKYGRLLLPPPFPSPLFSVSSSLFPFLSLFLSYIFVSTRSSEMAPG